MYEDEDGDESTIGTYDQLEVAVIEMQHELLLFVKRDVENDKFTTFDEKKRAVFVTDPTGKIMFMSLVCGEGWSIDTFCLSFV